MQCQSSTRELRDAKHVPSLKTTQRRLLRRDRTDWTGRRTLRGLVANTWSRCTRARARSPPLCRATERSCPPAHRARCTWPAGKTELILRDRLEIETGSYVGLLHRRFTDYERCISHVKLISSEITSVLPVHRLPNAEKQVWWYTAYRLHG